MAAIGIQGHRIYIDEDGDAEANYTVVALQTDERQSDPEMAGKSLQPIGHFTLRQQDIPVSSVVACLREFSLFGLVELAGLTAVRRRVQFQPFQV